MIIKTPGLFLFGLSKKTRILKRTAESVCLWGKEGLGSEEREFYEKMKEIVEHCEKVLESMGHKNVDLNPFYNKKDENGKILKERSPVLYAKVP